MTGLVCPACRRVQDGRLVDHELLPGPLGLRCPGCGRDHPVVDGVPLVLRDLDAWLSAEAPALLRRTDLDPLLEARLSRGAGGVAWRDLRRRAASRPHPDSALAGWLAEVLRGLEGEILELGCGGGTHGDPRPVGVDLHWDSLRRYPGRKVLADALDPPFRGEAFDAVLAVNLLDSCRDPFLLLQQADALLRPGGTLVLVCPFHWREEVTAPADWLHPVQVQGFLDHRGHQGTRGEVEWILAPDERTTVHHRCLTWVTRRGR